MAKKPDWDYALRIRGVTLKTLPIAVLADFLKEFSALLGDEAKPVLDSIVRGSVLVRAKQAGGHPAYTRERLRNAAHDRISPAGRSFSKIENLMQQNGAFGAVLDRQGNSVVEFPKNPKLLAVKDAIIVSDTGELDGQVVGISGADDTVHLRLQDKGGTEYKITVRDINMAQELARRFRSDIVRVHVHGTWRRDPSGKWMPHAVYADSIEILDTATPKQIVDELRAIKTGWSEVEDPLKVLADIRGDNDLHD